MDEPGVAVVFNEATAALKRIDAWEVQTSLAMQGLMSFDADVCYHNFISALTSINNIYAEIQGELTDLERKKASIIKGFLDYNTENNIFYQRVTQEGFGRTRTSTRIIQSKFLICKKQLEEYRLMISQLKKVHGFSNPEKEADGGDGYD